MCYKCHLPFFNGRLHPAKSDDIEGCNMLYNDMVAPLVWTMYMVKDHQERLKKYAGMQWQDDVVFRQWLCSEEKVIMEGKTVMGPFTNMCAIFIWAAMELVVR